MPRSADLGALAALLPGVVTEVAEQVFFGWAEVCPVEAFAALLDPAASGGWLHAEVAFDGVPGGALRVALPSDLALELGSAMSGEPDLAPAALADVAAEMANMICGALLTRGELHHPFSLRPPAVTYRPAFIPPAARAGLRLWFAVNERPLVVELELGPAA